MPREFLVGKHQCFYNWKYNVRPSIQSLWIIQAHHRRVRNAYLQRIVLKASGQIDLLHLPMGGQYVTICYPVQHFTVILNTVRKFHYVFNTLWPDDAIRRHRYWLASTQVMACCLMAPNHYLNQCCLTISEVPWQPPESNVTINTSAIN